MVKDFGYIGLYGSFRKQGDPNIDPQNTTTLIMGTPQ